MSQTSEFDPLGLEPKAILDEAVATTNLEDFGDDAFREPFTCLLDSLETEADLTLDGRGMQHARILGLLVNRLRSEELIRQHPEILDEEIREPLVIVGLARTGTTMLQRMISADPDRSCLYWWESRNPAPFPGSEDAARDPRIVDAEAEVEMMLEGAPDLMAMHPMEAEGPDEEIMLLEHAFYSSNPEAFANLPGYAAWQAEQDQSSAYRYLHRLLQLLQWQKRQRGERIGRWVLKTPHHLGFMELLFDTLPEARIVQTHRDPLQTIPSLASLIQTIRCLGSETSDPRLVGRQWSDKMSRALASCIEFREGRSDRFLDVDFRDVMADPFAEVRRIYEFAGLELADDALASMRQWAVDNSRDKREAHHYTLEEFGLTRAGIERDFATYREHFVKHA